MLFRSAFVGRLTVVFRVRFIAIVFASISWHIYARFRYTVFVICVILSSKAVTGQVPTTLYHFM